jgi:hypothetical protein
MDIMREVASTGAYVEPERYRTGKESTEVTTVSSEKPA